MSIAFISDLHLSPDTADKNRLFYALLNQLIQQKFTALYILGDFFDYWLGDDDINDFSQEMISHLYLASTSLKIYFIGGNHDFTVGKRFAKASGVTILKDLTTIELETQQRVLLSHGDTFCTLDHGYQRMKKIIRNPFLLFVLKRLPLVWRYKIKLLMESGSKKTHKAPKPSAIYNVVSDTIMLYSQKFNASTVIHGHTHRPGKYIIKNNTQCITRLELPDWEDREAGEYLVYADKQFLFKKFLY